jgi:hypothetical protein
MSGFVQGFISAKANKKAANVQAKAYDAATAEQQREFDLQRADYKPYLDTGTAALGRLNALQGGDMSSFYTSPDYQFRKSQGMQGIENSFSAQGGAKSGNALKALNEYNSNLASGEFGNYFNREAALAGIGQSATNAVTQAGANTSNNIANLMVGSGDARASGILGADAAFWNRYDAQHSKGQNIFSIWAGMYGGGGRG